MDQTSVGDEQNVSRGPLMEPKSNIWYIFKVEPQADKHHHKLLGKIWIDDGHLTVLEDHGLDADVTKMAPPQVERFMKRMASSQRRMVVNESALQDGQHPELMDSLGSSHAEDPVAGPQTSKFEYHRDGMPGHQELLLQGVHMFLDGHRLEPEEAVQVHNNIATGKATIRHMLPTLAKIEAHLTDALGQVRSAVKAGHVHPNVLKTLNRSLFTDTMVPSVGNKMAYQDFLSRPRGGVHIHLDATGFGKINKQFGFDTGNHAIVAFGKAIRQAVDESVGRKQAKVWRPGGDEFRVHVPNADHAAAFSRALRSKLDAIPALRGVYRFATGMGAGSTPDEAEHSLLVAKDRIAQHNKPWGQAQTEVEFHPSLKKPKPSDV